MDFTHDDVPAGSEIWYTRDNVSESQP